MTTCDLSLTQNYCQKLRCVLKLIVIVVCIICINRIYRKIYVKFITLYDKRYELPILLAQILIKTRISSVKVPHNLEYRYWRTCKLCYN